MTRMLHRLPTAPSNAEPAPFFTLDNVSWEFYEQTLEELDRQQSHVRVTYDDGRMELMTLTNRHEQTKKLVARLIELYAMERDIDIVGVGSVTLRRKEKRKGLKPDECYYVKTPAPRLNVMRLNLKRYPPPDLGIEIDITRGSIERQPIYAVIGVPEVWRFDGEEVVVLHRRRDGTYKRANKSLSFPKLRMADVNRYIAMAAASSQSTAVRAFRDHLRATA